MQTTTPSELRRSSIRRSTWRRGFDDLPREHGFEPLRVEGRLPEDLRGTFYWNGPGLLSAFCEQYLHWFDGDGAVGAVRFGPRGAEGAVRLVQTRALLAERAAGRRLYSRLLQRSPRPIREWFRGETRNPTNVNVVRHDGRLLALGIGRPIELSADLSTIGEHRPEETLFKAFCAHPHYSAKRRALYGFGLRMRKRTMLEVYELRDGGPRRVLASIPMEAPSFVHDCWVTDSHVLIVVPPLRFRVLPMLLSVLPAWRALDWAPQHGTELLVVPIDAPEKVVRLPLPAFFAFHFANAYEDGARILADLPCCEGFGRVGRWLERLAQGGGVPAPDAKMRRIAIDLRARTASIEPISDAVGEMPRVSPRVESGRHRFVYQIAFRSENDGAPDLISKLNVESGKTEAWDLGGDAYPSEPVVAPRAGAPAEDDAYLLTLVYDGATHTSHVAVLDAARPDAPPRARVHFDHHVPFTFHGFWEPDARVEAS